MTRKGSIRKRETLPDPIFQSVLVAKMVSYVMREGKKSVAERIVYGMLDGLKGKAATPGEAAAEPIKVFNQAISNVRPHIEVRPRRIGGATYQIPTEVTDHRGISLALRWIIASAKARSGKSMVEKLTYEVLDANNNRGGAVTMRENKRKMADANKAFAHYRW